MRGSEHQHHTHSVQLQSHDTLWHVECIAAEKRHQVIYANSCRVVQTQHEILLRHLWQGSVRQSVWTSKELDMGSCGSNDRHHGLLFHLDRGRDSARTHIETKEVISLFLMHVVLPIFHHAAVSHTNCTAMHLQLREEVAAIVELVLV